MNSPQTSVEELLDFGMQPVCSHFLRRQDEYCERHPLALSLDRDTGLVFLRHPFPVASLVPHFDWIRYNEPEAHLDDMVQRIVRQVHLTPESRIGGISYKDDSTLERFRERGFANTWRLDPDEIGITNSNANIESIQHHLTAETATHIAEQHGTLDVLVVRHIVEHAENPAAFLAALKALLRPDGVLIIEVPDCARSMERLDYTMAWEEHTLYFTEATFSVFCRMAGLELDTFYRHPYPFENSLIGFLRAGTPDYSFPPEAAHEIARAHRYAAAFPACKAQVQDFFMRHVAEGIALFGAGHLTASFVNLFEVAGHIRFVVDDNPNKQGLFLPGSGLPIYPSQRLAEENIGLCLMGVNPAVEEKIVPGLREKVGKIYSIFGGSPYHQGVFSGSSHGEKG